MRRITIAGLGLIGGSLGMALRRKGWRVAYVDPAVALEDAIAAGAADERLDSASGDVVVIATPVDVARRIRTSAPVVTTTCSVMLPFAGGSIVAGHPFAGSEQSGLTAARADLFAGRPWFVEREQGDVRAIVDAAGADQVVVDPGEHDRAMALTSHLPQVISTALASLIEQKNIDPVYFGSGLRTLLRLAGSSYEVWRPVLEANRENVREAAEELRLVIERLERDHFDRARAWFERRR